jgi:glycosyltransferase involved in cell wall biosynthesis
MARPLTIFHLVSLMGIGGRCATALRQMRLLAARGHRVILGCLPGSTAAARGREMGLEVFDDFSFRRGFRPGAFFGDCSKLARRSDDAQADIVHAHLSQESWVACLGVKLCRRRPRVVRSRGVVVPIQPHAFNRWMHNSLTDRLIVPSEVIQRHVLSLPGFDSARVSLIADGVDTQRFRPDVDGAAVRAEFNIPDDAPLVVMIARLEPVKGHTVFFRALKELRERGGVPNFRALCACDERTPGVFARTVREAREQWGLDESLLAFTGMRDDPERVIAAANVVALPSLGSEGSSRVALEAGAAGVSVIASDAGCLPDVIRHGETGWIVPRGESTQLADALQNALGDPGHAKALGHAARARVEAEFSETQMIERLEAAYASTLVQK